MFMSIWKNDGHAVGGRKPRMVTLIFAAVFSLAGCGGDSSADKLPVLTKKLHSEENHQKNYSYYYVGDPGAKITKPPSRSNASFALLGGDTDVDSAFRWMIEKAGITPETGGRLVIIRADGEDGYNDYVIYSDESLTTSNTIADGWVGGASLGLSSVETVVIKNTNAANDPLVKNIIDRADAVFIAGGAQNDYINYWNGTQLQSSLKQLMKNNVPIGGTGAGLSVMGQFVYSALNNSVESVAALNDPFDADVTLFPEDANIGSSFLAPPQLASILLDSLFDEENRMGRLIAFLSRLVAPDSEKHGCPGGIVQSSPSVDRGVHGIGVRGIGISGETALLVEGNAAAGSVTARRITNASNTTSESAVYFVRPLEAPSQCAPQKPLTIQNVEVRKLADSNTVFNLSEWSGVPVYKRLNVDDGKLSESGWQ